MNPRFFDGSSYFGLRRHSKKWTRSTAGPWNAAFTTRRNPRVAQIAQNSPNPRAALLRHPGAARLALIIGTWLAPRPIGTWLAPRPIRADFVNCPPLENASLGGQNCNGRASLYSNVVDGGRADDMLPWRNILALPLSGAGSCVGAFVKHSTVTLDNN
jgi:hypothetical protein